MVQVYFLHPDLGIGGAERLVVDAAVALQEHGHEVKVFTTHHDPNHCFPETVDGTLEVHCMFDWLPRTIFGKCAAVCAYVRMMLLALYVALFRHYNVAFVDQVSACLPILRMSMFGKSLFYCHYPDMLLTTRKSLLKKAYRYVLDTIEERTTNFAHKVLVNSQFTAHVFKETFKSIKTDPTVLYPSINVSHFDDCPKIPLQDLGIEESETLILSVNRFERKKNLPLALKAFNLYLGAPPQKARLVIAGGYDPLNVENIEHYEELRTLTAELGISDHVTFLKSPDEVTKVNLLKRANCLLYTPEGEHFGIVPVEAMCCRTPVIACNSGGPLETVVTGQTGFLCPNDPSAFREAISEALLKEEELGEAGRARVVEKFSSLSFAMALDQIVLDLVEG